MKLFLVDGNSYVYRAFYAIKGLTNSKGFPTNAIFGFTNMLLRIIKEKRPDGIVVSFDTPEPTERHRVFEAYKAHRPETPGDLVRQLPSIRQVIEGLNIPIFELPGYEADDILCTIAKKAEKEGAQVFIVTSDKDMLQIVSTAVKIYDPVKNRVLDDAYVKEKFGVGPGRIPEFMALAGDAVDNIPGVKGIGEKTAKELLADFETIDDLLDHPERIKKEKLRNLILEHADMVRMSKLLATIDTSVPIDVDLDAFRLKEPDWSSLLSLFREFEFGSLMKMIPSGRIKGDYETVGSLQKLNAVVSALKHGFAFDIESTGRNTLMDSIVGIALCSEKGKAYYLPFSHAHARQLEKREALETLSAIFGDEGVPKIGHNLKFDMAMLKREGIVVRGMLFDTMLASYLINPNKPDHSLGDVSFEYLSYRKRSFQEILGKRSSFTEVSLGEATAYAGQDAALAFELKDILFSRLRDEGLENLYQEIEMPLIPVLIDVEEAGFKVDTEKLNAMSKELSRELDAIQRRIFFLAGEEFNINSPKQLSKILFHTLGLKPGKKTKTGFSTEVSVLEELAATHELPHEILNYRSLIKLKSTYTDVLPELINPRTDRIHTSFNQAATATGRLSSSEPNLQNIPVRGEWGRRIRETFIAEKGHFVLSADYSQIELRILAHLSGDKGLRDAFNSNLDIHTRTASEIFNVPLENVSPEMRRVAKTVNFGIIYGISPFGLSGALSIPTDAAKKHIDSYFRRHPGVKGYIENTLSEVRKKGYTRTLFGRKRAIPELQSSNANTRMQGERLAINSPIQGTAADLIKIAMITIHRRLLTEGLRSRMILQVHDELVFESPEEELHDARRVVQEGMEGVIKLSVPLRVETGYGRNWAEAHG